MKNLLRTAAQEAISETREALRIDFRANGLWVKIALAAVLFGVQQWQATSTANRVSSVETALSGLRDTLVIISSTNQAQEAQVKEIRAQMVELRMAGRRREQAVKQLVALLKANGLTEKQALERIEKLNNTGLSQFFSTVTDE